MKYNDTKTSKFISLVLRHKPQVINKQLDEFGYMYVNDLLQGMNNKGYDITLEDLDRIVGTDEKERYSYNSTKDKIRANQGHSVKVNLDLKPIKPPDILYHGTCEDVKKNILNEGIRKMSRQYVHLSKDIETATKVGNRRKGKIIIFIVDAKRRFLDGYDFYISDNGVYLVDYVPNKYIKVVL